MTSSYSLLVHEGFQLEMNVGFFFIYVKTAVKYLLHIYVIDAYLHLFHACDVYNVTKPSLRA